MAVLTTNDKKDLVVTCDCGCNNAFHIEIDKLDDYDYYSLMCFMKSNWYTEIGPFEAFLIKLKKIWKIIRNKDHCYADICMNKDDYQLFKEYINQY